MPRTTEEKITIVKLFTESNLSQREFCKQHKIADRTLRKYIKAFDRPIQGSQPPMKYIELANKPSTLGDAPLPKEFPDKFILEFKGINIQIPGSVSAEYLGNLLKVVTANV